MKIGRLRHYLAVENPATSLDADGRYSEQWNVAEHVWADIDPVDSREEWRHFQAQIDATHRITIRYTATVSLRSRLRLGTRTFSIVRLRNVEERNVRLELLAKEDTT